MCEIGPTRMSPFLHVALPLHVPESDTAEVGVGKPPLRQLRAIEGLGTRGGFRACTSLCFPPRVTDKLSQTHQTKERQGTKSPHVHRPAGERA